MSNFHEVLVHEITIGDRFRKDYGNLEALKASITHYTTDTFSGLLEPIILDRENNLLAGGRRLRAFTELNRPRIPAQYLDEIDAIQAREIELEENVQRKDLDWAEQCELIAEIDALKKIKYAGQTKTASPDSPNFTSEADRERAIR